MTETLDGPSAPPAGDDGHLLAVNDLSVEFRTRRGTVHAVNGISYTVDERETLAILGESGSGKSVSAQAVMGILDTPPGFVTGGSIHYRSKDLLAKNGHDGVRGEKIAMIFQDALTALNPVFTVGWQLSEPYRVHRGTSKADARKFAIELMDKVHIPDAANRVDAYPHEFSGGMRQRVMIAMALALDPDLLIADEPTTALDVTVQAQVMQLLADLRDEYGMGLILITHDLGVVADVADKIAVMYAGEIVETASVYEVYANPAHPYTEGLLRSIPRADQKGIALTPITGAPPSLIDLPSGCSFHPRCGYARDRCTTDDPPFYEVGPGRASRCHYWQEVIDGH